jgi:BirA family biotin operon repressor/biotin-[acetyl-CoA-carboxylase] ligase
MSSDKTEQANEELILGFLADGGTDYTSGEALSDKLGLSRSAVWKHVNSLRHKGYRIDAVPARGYRLVEVPDRLTSLELAPLINTRDVASVIHDYESVASTNELAAELAHRGAGHGEVVIAEEQTKGRGRRGRAWESPKGLNLYFSVILRPDLPAARAPELTLVAAVAVAETLEDAGAEGKIKWPNDIQLEGKKCAGILTELTADGDATQFVVLGVGINLNMTRKDFPPELAETAISVREALGKKVPRALFAAALWTRLERWLDLHAGEGFGPVRAAWKRMSSTLGQEVLVKTERNELRGVAEDLDDEGGLLVRTPTGQLERITAGDVEQLRPRVQR